MSKLLIGLFILIVCCLIGAIIFFNLRDNKILPSHASGDVATLTSDPNVGGAITAISINGENIIDNADCGRLLQFAAFDPDRLAPTSLRCPGGSGQGFIYNPTQACTGCGKLNNPTSTPVLWDTNNAPGDLKLSQQIVSKGNNLWQIRATVSVPGGHPKYAGGYGAYLIPKYGRFVSYEGNSPWTNATATFKDSVSSDCKTAPPPQKVSEGWAGMINSGTNKGLIIIDPASAGKVTNWQFWPNVGCHGSNNVVFPNVFSGSTSQSRTFYVFVGDWQTGRNLAYQMLKPNISPAPAPAPAPSPSPTPSPLPSPSPAPAPQTQNSSCPNSNDVSCYDCNGDGEVNILDFTCFRNAYGKKT